jgi:hypothetical protein
MIPHLAVIFGLSILTVCFQTAHGQTANTETGSGIDTRTSRPSYRQTAPRSSAGSGARNIIGPAQQTNDAIGDAATALGAIINSAVNNDNAQQTQQRGYENHDSNAADAEAARASKQAAAQRAREQARLERETEGLAKQDEALRNSLSSEFDSFQQWAQPDSDSEQILNDPPKLASRIGDQADLEQLDRESQDIAERLRYEEIARRGDNIIEAMHEAKEEYMGHYSEPYVKTLGQKALQAGTGVATDNLSQKSQIERDREERDENIKNLGRLQDKLGQKWVEKFKNQPASSPPAVMP